MSDHGDRISATEPPRPECGDRSLPVGRLIEVLSSPHRVVAIVVDRALLCSITSHAPYLVQEEDGSIQLPRVVKIVAMLEDGEAALVPDEKPGRVPGGRMREQIRMLEEAAVPQGDKAIFLHLATHWSPDHERRFGPFDEPWKIRRWRAALRDALRGRRSGSREDRTRTRQESRQEHDR